MRLRFKTLVLPVVCLSLTGCFHVRDGRDDTDLRMEEAADAPEKKRDSSVPDTAIKKPVVANDAGTGVVGDAPSDAGSIDGSTPGAREPAGGPTANGGELQVWLGRVRAESGRAIAICGPVVAETDPQRALLLLELDRNGRLIAASLTISEGPSLPPVEDPDAYYPPEPPWTWHGCPMQGLVPGFEYTAYEARLDENRLSASIRRSEVIKPWCELQPSYPASPGAVHEWGEHLCRPTTATDPTLLSDDIPRSDDLSIFFPEEHCLNHNAACTCDAESCTASRHYAMPLDLVIDGGLMTGRFGYMEIKLERR